MSRDPLEADFASVHPSPGGRQTSVGVRASGSRQQALAGVRPEGVRADGQVW